MADRFRRYSQDSSLLEWPDCPIKSWSGMVFEVCPTLTLAWEGPAVNATFFKDYAPSSLYEAFQRFKHNKEDLFWFPLGYMVWSPLISLNFTAYAKNNLSRIFSPKWSKPKKAFEGDPGLLFSIRISDQKKKELICGGHSPEEAAKLWRVLKKYYDEIPGT